MTCVEVCGADDVIDALVGGMSHKSPKVPPVCVATIVEIVAAYGAVVLPFRKLVAKALVWMEDKDKKVKDEALKLLLELIKWLGKPSLSSLIAKLKEGDQKTIEKKTAKFKPPDPAKVKPPKTMRNPPPPPEGMTRDKDGNVLIDLIEPVDLLKELPKTEYKKKIGSAKWQDKVAALTLLAELCGSPPKLLPGNHDELIAEIVGTMGDKMAQVPAAAVKALGVLAQGLNDGFKKSAKSVAGTLLGKLKEKKLCEPVLLALSHVYGDGGLRLDMIIDKVENSVFPKKGGDKAPPPHAQMTSLQFLEACMKRGDIKIKPESMGASAKLCAKVMKEISDPKVKTAATNCFIAALARDNWDRKEQKGPIMKTLEKMAEAEKKPGPVAKLKAKIEEGAKEDAAKPVGGEGGTLFKEGGGDDAPDVAEGKDGGDGGGDGKKGGKKKKGAKGGKKGAKGGKKGAKGGKPAAPKEKEITPEEAAETLKALKIADWDAVCLKLGDAKWQAKKEGAEAMVGATYTGQVKAMSPALIAFLGGKTGGFKEKNFNVMRAIYGAIGACAAQSTEAPPEAMTPEAVAEALKSGTEIVGDCFHRPAASKAIAAAVESMGDKKLHEAISGMLCDMAESTSPKFVLTEVKKNLDKSKVSGRGGAGRGLGQSWVGTQRARCD